MAVRLLEDSSIRRIEAGDHRLLEEPLIEFFATAEYDSCISGETLGAALQEAHTLGADQGSAVGDATAQLAAEATPSAPEQAVVDALAWLAADAEATSEPTLPVVAVWTDGAAFSLSDAAADAEAFALALILAPAIAAGDERLSTVTLFPFGECDVALVARLFAPAVGCGQFALETSLPPTTRAEWRLVDSIVAAAVGFPSAEAAGSARAYAIAHARLSGENAGPMIGIGRTAAVALGAAAVRIAPVAPWEFEAAADVAVLARGPIVGRLDLEAAAEIIPENPASIVGAAVFFVAVRLGDDVAADLAPRALIAAASVAAAEGRALVAAAADLSADANAGDVERAIAVGAAPLAAEACAAEHVTTPVVLASVFDAAAIATDVFDFDPNTLAALTLRVELGGLAFAWTTYTTHDSFFCAAARIRPIFSAAPSALPCVSAAIRAKPIISAASEWQRC